MRIYIQLKTWSELEQYYPILKYLPDKLKLFIAKRWLKPTSIPWENGPDLYLLPICQESKFTYSMPNSIVLPQDERNKQSSLITTLLIDILPQLAKLVSVNYEEDTLLIKDLETIADVRLLKQLIEPWRYVVIHGTNKLKIKWWQEFCIRESGQVLQLRESLDEVNISCICTLDSIPKLSQIQQPKLLVAVDSVKAMPPVAKIASNFRVNISKEYPIILSKLYNEYLPPVIVDEWLKTTGIYHQTLSSWYDAIREELGVVNVVDWSNDFVYVKIG